ncbi:type II and III secretion system protein family protein [Duganella phyllosphaerae]|uniref:Type II secretion system protein D n=1 Tax=Duganella phyllosphaerae TaxID=762836 RepID=A0A1E7X6W3_9BURK|nr:type II and III secretion system protein family protein [Duganella phyllosphaerae]OFA08867.1 type II secretion system protein D precursor [Duganella phyllosphaerae]
MTVFSMTAKPAPAAMMTLAVLAALAAMPLAATVAHAQGKAKAPATAAPAASAAIATTPPGLAGTPAGNASSVQMAQQIELSEGKSTLMHLPYPAARLAVGDARVADVILINPSEVYMLGKATGTTNLILWNKANQATIIDISVGIDAAPLRQQFAALFPTERDIVVTVSGNALILSGSVADTIRAGQVVAVATAYLQRGARGAMSQAPVQAGAGAGAGTANNAGNGGPGTAGAPLTAVDSGASLLVGGSAVGSAASRVVNMLSVAAPQQVMLEVKIAEVSKSLVDQLGASIGVAGTAGNWTYSLLSNLLTGNSGKLDAFNGKNGNFATLDAQKRDGLVKILAEPTLLAISGQEASFLAGGKIYIPVAQDGSGGSTRITLEEKEYGVAVKFTPTVLEGGRINLRVAPEVSEINREGIGISATGSTATAILPAFTTRRASTTVQLYDGQSFAIGGLIKNNVTTSIKAFPGLGEIPILGALFRSSDFQSDRTELVFIVTPHLARPLAPNPKLPTDDYVPPNRLDFFGMGKLEGRAPAPAPAPAPAEPKPAAAGFDVK